MSKELLHLTLRNKQGQITWMSEGLEIWNLVMSPNPITTPGKFIDLSITYEYFNNTLKTYNELETLADYNSLFNEWSTSKGYTKESLIENTNTSIIRRSHDLISKLQLIPFNTSFPYKHEKAKDYMAYNAKWTEASYQLQKFIKIGEHYLQTLMFQTNAQVQVDIESMKSEHVITGHCDWLIGTCKSIFKNLVHNDLNEFKLYTALEHCDKFDSLGFLWGEKTREAFLTETIDLNFSSISGKRPIYNWDSDMRNETISIQVPDFPNNMIYLSEQLRDLIVKSVLLKEKIGELRNNNIEYSNNPNLKKEMSEEIERIVQKHSQKKQNLHLYLDKN